MMKLFDYLYFERNKKFFNDSEEFNFFKSYKRVLENEPSFAFYADTDSLFDIIKANIIIKGILNKNTLEQIIEEEYLNKNFNMTDEIIENIKERSLDLPYLKIEDQKVFIPFFNRSTNLVYTNNFEELFKEPYIDLTKKFAPFIVNPFETYQIDLFDSLFTKFVRVSEDLTSVAFYDYDLRTIFIINKQGYLDNFICLFDKHLKNPSEDRIIERIKLVIKEYYDNNLTGFLYSMYENSLISYYVYRKLCKWKKI